MVMRQPMALRVASSILLSGFTLMLALGGLTSGSDALRWLGPLAAIPAAFVTARNWRLRIVVSGEGLLIANLLRTRNVPWAEVDRAVNEGGVVVRLRSGQQFSVAAFTDVPGALPLVRRRNAHATRQLQAAIRHHRDR